MKPEPTLAALSRELYRLEGALPALAVRREFEQQIQAGQFLVVKGETGSGKSTQLPQYLADMHSIQGQVSLYCRLSNTLSCELCMRMHA